ncbi:MAG: MBL fold metallo-hydrolase [Halodesulfurarchaeum sp.]
MSGQSREIEPGFHWIQEPGPDQSRFATEDYEDPPDWYDPDDSLHVAQNAYLLDDERSLLFDTLSPASTDPILDELDALLDDGLDYLVVSHPDVPHAGNTGPILEAYPEATLVAPAYGNAHELYHLEDAEKVRAGDSIDLGRFEVTFHHGTFPDAPVHVWMSEQRTGTLFPVDWLGYPHRGSEILQFPDEFETEITVDRLIQYHGRVLFWFQYVDVDSVQTTIDRLVERHEPDLVAPSHGNPIRENPIEVMERGKAVVDQVRKRGRVGTLG